MARAKKSTQPVTTAQSLASIIKSARDLMRKDKGLNGDLDRLPMLTCRSVEQRRTLQQDSTFGNEAKPMPYLLTQMNLLLHGLDYPQIDYGNALTVPLKEIGDKDRVDVILTNPPFGGEEERGILSNFPNDMQIAETALLFLQLLMRKLRRHTRPGRAGVVVPNGTLFGDGVCARIKEDLLKNFNLHTIVRLPNGVFTPYTPIPINLLFFDRSGPTKEIWYYEQPLPEGRKNYTKTRPMQHEDCLAWWGNRQENDRAWRVKVEDVLRYDESGGLLSANLDIKNPKSSVDLEHLPPEKLMEDILRKEDRIAEILREIRSVLGESP
jgi:type I restriction enzyme M protein